MRAASGLHPFPAPLPFLVASVNNNSALFQPIAVRWSSMGGLRCVGQFWDLSRYRVRVCRACMGTERWPVKVGTDRDARKVGNLPQATTIEQLISIAALAHPETRRSTRFAPTELTTFQIKRTAEAD